MSETQEEKLPNPNVEQNPVIITQPGSTDHLIGHGAGNPSTAKPGSWTTGVCGCKGSCLDVIMDDFKMPFSIYELARSMNQTDSPNPFCIKCYLGELRTRTRLMFNIEGTSFDDGCWAVWCPTCVIGQIKREFKTRQPITIFVQPVDMIRS